MELKFLGRGSAFNTKEGNTSAYYKQGDMMLLIDCGESVFKTIKENNVLDGVKDLNILITHLHSDHAGSLSSLIMYCYYCLGIKPNVYFPNMGADDFIEFTGAKKNILWNKLNVVDFENKYGIFIKLIKVNHVNELKSYGYEIRDNNDNIKIFYSGDNDSTDINFLQYAVLNNYIIYHDCCLADYEENVHTSLRRLCELIPKEYRNNTWCMHLDCNELIQKAKEEGFNVVGNEF